MKCPVKHHGFARLPGQIHDDRARGMRRALQDDVTLADSLIGEFLSKEGNSCDPQVVVYAAGSIVIDAMWKLVTAPELTHALDQMRQKRAVGSYEERVTAFLTVYLGSLVYARRQYFEETKNRGLATSVDKAFYCFGLAASKYREDLKGLPVPSMADLVVLLGRMAFLAPVVFERDVGRNATSSEVCRILRHQSVLTFFTELMANNRVVTMPLLAMFEGVEKVTLNNIEGRFNPDFFEVIEKEGEYVLKVRNEVTDNYRTRLQEASCMWPPSRTLGCPALYTGKFREYFYWFCDGFEAWMTHT